MKTRLIFLVVLLFLLAVPLSASAFDGERKGFMLGLGLGFGQGKLSWTDDSVDGTGFGSDLKIGGGPSNQVHIYYTNRVLWWEPSGFSQKAVTGMTGAGVSYFLQPEAPSFFFSGAVGFGILTDTDYDDSEDGLGFTLGVGYEVSKNFVFEFTYMRVSLDTPASSDPAISNLFFGINWWAY